MQENLQRIKHFESEAAVLEGSLSNAQPGAGLASLSINKLASHSFNALRALNPAWYPVAFASQLADRSMAPFDFFGQPWVLFRDAAGQPACIKDECAHRACPLSLVSSLPVMGLQSHSQL